ncbi:MAG: OsmC family protein [Burkholderiales bacterium]|nr:OsmC family protein [Burkholderiales bacterium]
MVTRTSSAQWDGSLKSGSGRMRLGSGAYEGPFSFASRFESGPGTNPEELIGAAHAGCYSMFLSALLDKAGTPAKSIRTSASVRINDALTIDLIELDTVAEVPGLSAAKFLEQAEAAKAGCPVSKALAGPEIRLKARLAGA